MIRQLPRFKRTAPQCELLEQAKNTRAFIRGLWEAASPNDRRQAAFLALLVQAGWNNYGKGSKGRVSTRQWRNERLAEFLDVEPDDTSVAKGLAATFPALRRTAVALLELDTGITRCYGPLRPLTLQFVEANPSTVASAFREVASQRKAETKLKKVMKLVSHTIQSSTGKKFNLLNGITPALACLDPDQRFPIMNFKTKGLLKQLSEEADYEGAVELYRQIGRHNIKDSLELDVYAATQFPRNRRKGRSKRRRRPKD